MFLLTFVVAVVVNFVGYLPFGNINLTAVQMSVNKGMKQALVFILTFSIFEACFTYVLMRFAEWFATKKDLMHWLDWILIVVFIILGTSSWSTAKKELKQNTNHRKRDSIKTGIILGIFNPMQIPFWMIGGTYLISHQWITTDGFGLEIFAVGAAIGAFSALYLFARFAQYIQSKFALSHQIINKSVACIFFTLAIIHVVKLGFFK